MAFDRDAGWYEVRTEDSVPIAPLSLEKYEAAKGKTKEHRARVTEEVTGSEDKNSLFAEPVQPRDERDAAFESALLEIELNPQLLQGKGPRGEELRIAGVSTIEERKERQHEWAARKRQELQEVVDKAREASHEDELDKLEREMMGASEKELESLWADVYAEEGEAEDE